MQVASITSDTVAVTNQCWIGIKYSMRNSLIYRHSEPFGSAGLRIVITLMREAVGNDRNMVAIAASLDGASIRVSEQKPGFL